MAATGRPLIWWIGGGVVVAHLLFFALVWNKRVLPRLPPPPATPLPVNFTTRSTRSLDPQTGETRIERDFTVSTHFATPTPSPAR